VETRETPNKHPSEYFNSLCRLLPIVPVPPVPAVLARGLQLILVAGQRPGEVFGMKWEHISEDGTWWDMPRSLTKSGNAHRVPFTKTAQDILKPAKTGAPKGDATIDVFAGHMNASVTARAKKIAATLSGWEPLGFTFHRHDLRRTASTGMAAEGILTGTITRVMNHVIGTRPASR
jgi:integrase